MEAQVNIHYLQPYATDGLISEAYNKAVAFVSDGDWVCITDQDVMFLHPKQKAIIQAVANEGKHDLYGCLFNRLNVKDQCVAPMFDNPNISEHLQLAEQLMANGTECKTTKGPIAGALMLFPKSTWQKSGGFPILPRGLAMLFDAVWSETIPNRAIMQGVYLFHLYRWWSDNPKNDLRHLQQ